MKTLIGRIARGFDFLGYRFAAGGLAIAAATAEQLVERAARLCEHDPRDAARLGVYVERWRGWAAGGPGDGVAVRLPPLPVTLVANLHHLST